jgi:serine/threonine protein kinase/predicted Zn-dependent protease
MRYSNCQTENSDESRFCARCGAPLAPSAASSFKTETLRSPRHELTTGLTFAGRYQIIEELGHGGMGSVYKVLDAKVKEKVALKLIRPEIAVDPETLERFGNELRLARKISHRNVCRMYDLGEAEGAHYITMEYVHGEDLKALIRKFGCLSVGQAVGIAHQVCQGLAEAHRLGVIHRDLKPSNIMIDEEGTARIMDFGIARSVKAKGITGGGVIIGTPEYMSPEQVEGKDVDPRSDIYSLGIILFEMVTGRVPFEGDTPFTVGVKHKSERPEDPHKLNPQIPVDLSRLILKCLEKDKAKRYQSAEELGAELSRLEQGMPTTERRIVARPLTSREITVKFNLKKLAVPGAAVLVLALAAVLWLTVLKSKTPVVAVSSEPTLAVLYFENVSREKDLEDWRTGLSDLLITDLAQSRYLNILSGEAVYSALKNLNLLDAKKYSQDDLAKVAAETKANRVLTGSLLKAGDKIILTAALQDPRTGKIVRTMKEECAGEAEIPAKVDAFTREIKSALNLTPAQISQDIDREVGEITSSNPEAYRFYVEGRKYHNAGKYRESIALMEKAVSLDPEFAMAYRSLAIAYSNLGLVSEGDKFLQKALSLSRRLSERERLQIEGDYYREPEATYEQGRQAYEKLLQIYPGSTMALNNLGTMFFGIEDWGKATEYFEKCVRAGSEFIGSYQYLAFCYAELGYSDKGREALLEGVKSFPDNAFLRHYLAHFDLCRGDFDSARSELESAFAMDPTHFYNNFLRGALDYYLGDWTGAEREFQKLLEEKEPEAIYRGVFSLAALYLSEGRFMKAEEELNRALEIFRPYSVKWVESEFESYLAYAYLAAGRAEEALKASDEAWKTGVEAGKADLQRDALHHRGLAQLAMRALADAEGTSAQMKELVEKSPFKKDIRRYHDLVGRIELERGQAASAVKHFEDAVALLPQIGSLWREDNLIWEALYWEPLARAYEKAGDLARSRGVYEKIVKMIAGRFLYGDIYSLSFYRLGQIAEKQGERAKAREYYAKFLELWKDADPGRPEINDARKRLAELS